MTQPSQLPSHVTGRRRSAAPGQRLLSGQQAEAEYGVPYTSLRDLVFRGVLPVVRFPKTSRWWFRREDIEKLIERSVEKVG